MKFSVLGLSGEKWLHIQNYDLLAQEKMKGSLSHCREFAKSIQELLSGQAGYQIWSRDREGFFSRDTELRCCSCVLGMSEFQQVQRGLSKPKGNEPRGQVKPSKVLHSPAQLDPKLGVAQDHRRGTCLVLYTPLKPSLLASADCSLWAKWGFGVTSLGNPKLPGFQGF